MLSYWERESFLTYDHIIIGGGIVGMSTALSIRQRDPLASILILERGLLPTGASTRNAGFACIGSLTEILDDLHTMTPAEVVALVALRRAGLRRLRDRLGDDAIGYAENGSYELITEGEVAALDHLYHVNELLRPLLGSEAFSRCDEKIRQFGLGESVRHLIRNHHEGQLHSGRAMRALIGRCLEQRIEIKTGAEVIRVEEQAHYAEVLVAHTHLAEQVAFRAGSVAICTNAFTNRLLPGLDIQPGRGQVLITKPIPGLKVKGIFHFDQGYYYFREVDGRILFGGGRHLDFEGERTESFAHTDLILSDLRSKLAGIILPHTPFEIDYTWSGIMAFGSDKAPVIRQHSPHIYLGVRMGGMGVAIGSEVGEQLAAMMVETKP